jgi:gem associated protein 5
MLTLLWCAACKRCSGKVSDFVPISGDGIHSMAMSPHEKALVAVGYRSGVLCLVDAAQGTVRHRLAGQDQEVQCVAWKMVVESSRACGEEDADTVEADVSGPKVWLASASRDKTIKVWKMSGREEPALEQALRLPTGKQGMSYTQTKQLWLPVAWSLTGNDTAGKHCLWSGSFDGSLFRWEWTADQVNTHEKKGKNRRVPCKPVVVKGGHNRMLFSIVMVPPRRATPAESEAVSMLTVSLDRELRLWKDTAPSTSSAAAICVEKLTGLGGHAYSVSYNASTGLVAAGIGDQTIRLWSLSSENATAASDYQCDLLWKGLQSKVTCVRWHPLQHSLLAYGMEDGRIGVYDIQTKKYNHFRTAHNHEVRELQWVVLKPKKPADGDNAFLESIKQLEAARKEGQSLEEALTVQEDQGGKPSSASGVQVLLWSGDTAGRVLESNADALDQKSRELMANSVAFAWNERCELVAMGRSNGVVEVAKRNGKASDVITRFHEHLESVSCLTWSNGTNAGLLASGGEDGKIFIYSCADSDLEEGLTGASGAEQEGRLFGSIAAHSNKITGLKWCSDAAQGFLASSSADGTVQVWSSTSLEREARFNHHIGRVLSLDWASPYTLVTGGEDQTLRLWDYREQQKEPSLTQKKTGKVKQPQDFETLVASAPAAVMQQEEAATLSGSRKPQTPSKKPQKKTSGVFHPGTKLTPAEMASACCKAVGLQRASSVAAERKDAVGCLLSHRDRASLRGFFASESKRFRDERDWEGLANTLLIQGDITEALRVVAKEGALTSTWLSYAPMAGMDVWREMTNLYAHQLDAQGDKKAAGLPRSSVALGSSTRLTSRYLCASIRSISVPQHREDPLRSRLLRER